MRSQFRNTFQPARRISGGFQPAMVRAPYRPVTPLATLGTEISYDERTSILDKIDNGNKRMAAVRKWIASRIDQDPMLRKTFGEQYISDNFWGYMDLIDKDQYYVNLITPQLAADLEMWDVDDNARSYVDEWAQVVDIAYSAMQEYGKVPLTTPGGATVPNTTPPSTTVPPASGGTGGKPPAGGGKIPAGTSVKTPPPTGGTILGLPSKDVLLYGGIGLGAIALVAIIKKYT